jgi:hypothetical protein
MSLQVPNLDDRRFADLVEEARTLLPAHTAAWTDYNASDPGITLLELFAWLAEMLIYRANQVTDAHVIAFLRLLGGPDWPDWEWQPDWNVEDQLRSTLQELRSTYRAVTVADWEQLALESSPAVARVRCVPRRSLATGRDDDRPGAVSVIVVPAVRFAAVLESGGGFQDVSALTQPGNERAVPLALAPGDAVYFGASTPFAHVEFDLEPPGRGYTLSFAVSDGAAWADAGATDRTNGWQSGGRVELAPAAWSPGEVDGVSLCWLRVATSSAPPAEAVAAAQQISTHVFPEPDPDLLQAVWGYLDPRRILTTRHEVVGPRYVDFGVEALVARREDAPEETVRELVLEAIEELASPLVGGADGGGFAFGRPVYVSDLYARLERLAGVDYVPDLRLYAAASDPPGAATSIWSDAGEQVGLDLGAYTLPRPALDRTRIVTATTFVPVTITVTLAKLSSVAAADARRIVSEGVRALFHPLSGGPDGSAPWTQTDAGLALALGPAVAAAGVVSALSVDADAGHRARDDQGAPELVIQEGELVDVQTFVELA